MAAVRVIKAGQGTRVVPQVVGDAKAQAREILAGAEAAVAEARAAGFAAGREAGLAEVAAIVAGARAAAGEREAAAADELRRLAVRIAGKLLGRELAMAPEAVVDLVHVALAEARARREIVIRVHPEDAPLVEAARARLGVGQRVALAVRADAALGRGDCRIDTEVGTIDGRVAVQLAAIEAALTGSSGSGDPT